MHKINIKFRITLIKDWFGRSCFYLQCLYRTKIQRKKSFYLPIHPGELPIRVLKGHFELWLKTVNPVFFSALINQMRTNGLSQSINYNDQRVPIVQNNIVNAAKITYPNRQIHIYDTFSAYLWCICYSMTVLFDEVVQKPHLRGNYTGEINPKNKQVDSALGLFEYGMTLRDRYRDWDRGLPNPEEYNCEHAYYIEKTSGMYLAALYFIFCHEVGHNVFNHVTYTPATPAQSLADELAADNYAIDQILLPENSQHHRTFKYGAVAAMCSLLFLSPNLYRGGYYPNAHERVNNIIDRLNLDARDNIWGMASLAFRMWGKHYSIEFRTPEIVETYMDLFNHILIELQGLDRPGR
ncbi:phage exclusion protein Lit family protein [Flavobacterium sp.]|uniref:phage exclusion protein Lit family protein n=1 Tax=Flavobacterium sp. TaxID=239 RepID=UPI003D6B3539